MRPSLLCAYPLGDRDPHRKEGKEGMHQRRHDCCRARRTWPTGVSSEWGGQGGADDGHGTRPPAVLSKAKAPGARARVSEETDTRRPVLSAAPPPPAVLYVYYALTILASADVRRASATPPVLDRAYLRSEPSLLGHLSPLPCGWPTPRDGREPPCGHCFP